MTLRARRAIEQADFVVGYRTYLDLIPDLLKGKSIFPGRMGGEIERVKLAAELVEDGSVALISSGDPNVYGMAGIALDFALSYLEPSRIEVIPGITAFAAAACKAGVVFKDSLAIISLSDLLTPWNEIEQRIKTAAHLGIPIAIYNPRSSKRDWQLARALEILIEMGRGEEQVLIARNVTRSGESLRRSSVEGLLENPDGIDMFTIILVGGIYGSTGDGVKIAGLGPGSVEDLSHEVLDEIRSATLLLGSERHLSQIKDICKGRFYFGSGGFEERLGERAKMALDEMQKGGRPLITVGGDPSVFSASRRYLEMASIKMLPGVSAFSAVAAKAGAPIANDFVLLSGRSRYLDPLVDAGFSVIIYNASSEFVKDTAEMIPGSRACAVGRDVTRKDEMILVRMASEMRDLKLDGSRYTMIIAGPATAIRDGKMVSRRGYEKKYCI